MARLVSSGIIGKGHNIFDDGGFGEVHADPIKVERPHKRPPQKQNAENGTTTKVDEPKELPKHVCFKGDNGLYLSARMVEGYPYLQFASDDIGDPSVRFTTYNYMIDGKRVIRVKSDHFGKFWRRSPNWIWCDTDDTSTDNRDTLFEVVKVGDDADAMYGLRNLGNNHICHRLTYEGKESCLNASIPSVRKEAQLKIEEAVLLRKIYGVDYHLKDAKILNNKVRTLVTREAVNAGSMPSKNTLTLKYVVSNGKIWDASRSLRLGIKSSFQAGVPEVVTGSITLESEFDTSYIWGENTVNTEEFSTDYEVIVPPHTVITVRILATQGTCQVPFSYTQEDILTTGEKKVTKYDDGIFRGVNSFGFKSEVTERKINGE